jgi:hypothetical protein
MRRLSLFAALLAFSLTASAQQFSSVEERMTGAEFKAAGLDKLSAEELKALNDWLRKDVGAAVVSASAQPPANADRRGLDAPESRDLIVSRIQGRFTGFDGSTRFVLENGQVWEQQGDGSTLTGMDLTNPRVTLKPALIGKSWYLQVEGYNKTAKVRRVQ